MNTIFCGVREKSFSLRLLLNILLNIAPGMDTLTIYVGLWTVYEQWECSTINILIFSGNVEVCLILLVIRYTRSFFPLRVKFNHALYSVHSKLHFWQLYFKSISVICYLLILLLRLKKLKIKIQISMNELSITLLPNQYKISQI